MNWLLFSLVVYLALQALVGIVIAKRIRTEDDFLVGGRNLGYPLTIFSIFATWFGAETCIASAGRAWHQGFALTTAEPMAYGLCLILMGLIFAGPLRRLGLTTPADLFRQRYSPGVERLAAAIIVPSSVFWAAAQLRGFAHVLTSITDFQLATATAVGAGFCIVYTVLGGLLADAVTDLIQGIVLLAGLVVLAGAVVLRLGGIPEAVAAVDPGRVALLGTAGQSTTLLALLEEWAIPVFGSVVAAELVSRVIAARTPGVARNGSVIAGGMYILVGLIPVGIGLTAGSLVSAPADPDRFLASLALEILPPWAYVLFAGAIMSAILSTVNTILLVSGGITAHNIVGPLAGVTEPRRALQLSRAGVVVFGVIAYFLAMSAEGITPLVEQASALGSAGVVVVVSFALFSRRGGPLAATSSLLGGLLAYVAGMVAEMPYPYLFSLAAALSLYLGATLLEQPRRKAA